MTKTTDKVLAKHNGLSPEDCRWCWATAGWSRAELRQLHSEAMRATIQEAIHASIQTARKLSE